MKRILSILLLLATVASLHAGETAAELISRVSAKYQAAKSITASFSITERGETVSGQITVSGSKYAMTSSALSTWFDGKTQWTYAPSAGEVNITEPTAEEQRQVNPFAVISSLSKLYNAAYDGSATGRIRKIVLTPTKAKTDLSRIVITLDTTTMMPTSLTLTDRRKKTTTIKITKAAEGKSVAASTFTWNAKKTPGAKVVDLR